PASAALQTCGTAGNWFAGRQTPVAAVIGTQADLVVRFGALCLSETNPPSNFNTSWVMLAAGSGGYSQSGHMRYFAGGTRHFSEYDRDGTGSSYPFVRRFAGNVTSGST